MNNVVRALSVSLILILSSLAGCLTDDETTDASGDDLDDLLNYGTVMVSTYHVGELVSAVAGESVTIEYMSQDNIPVHDYEPSASDLIRLQEADIFFYHGLNLEPWVESTLSSLGDDAPPSYMTHAMPSGASNLAYESLLISDLCELMNDGPFESTTLGMLSDDHDDHDAHEHAEAEMAFENPEACPAETTIQVFHMEEGEHILEFESVHEEDFNMAVLKMLGGHAHHDHHGHGDHADERDIAIEGNWVDEWGTNQTIDSDSWNSGTITQFDNSAMWAVAENGEDSFNPGLWSKYDWTWDSEELYYCQSTFAAESEADALSANSANSSDLEAGCGGFPWSQMSNADSDHDSHDDHDDHGDDMCHNTETHENYESTEEECEAAGHMWTGDGEHDEHHGEEMCHNTDTHENYESNEEDCESAGHVWMGHDDHDLPEIHSELVAHTFSFPEEMVCYDINTHTVNMSLTTESDCQAAGLMWTAANSGPSGDDQSDEEEHHEMGAVVIHIEAEGDYGFALPNDIRMHIVMGERGHDGHDGHDDHEGHDRDDHDDDDHGDDDDRDDHDDEIEAGDEEEVFTYDPHSWLSPIAFEAQINVVLTRLTSIFPDGSDSFTENAASYSVQLMDLHERYTAAFGVDGTCDMAGQEKTIVANHNAYSYMAVQYDIDIITLHGLDPEGEPSPADIAEVVESIEEKGITVLFVEEFTDQTALNSIVDQTGVTIEILYTMEMAPSDSSDNYLSMMNKNLENIISGCGC